MRKNLLIIAMLASSSVFAQDNNFDGFYFGSKTGVSFLGQSFKRSVEKTDSKDSQAILFSDSGIILGYGYRFADDFVGHAEISVVPNFLAGRNTIWSGSVSYLQGYVVDSFLPYVRGGLAFLTDREVEHKIDENGQVYHDYKTKFLFGFDAGLGVRYALSDNFKMGLEYSHKRIFIEKPDYADKTDENYVTSYYFNSGNINLTYQF